jgi:hypothetical protein
LAAIIAVVKQTIRASLRSRIFHVLFALILLAVIGLPLTVAGDGTAMGQLQVCLTYSLGVVTSLISTATLWLGCSMLSREIEAYNMHLVLTKATPPWQVWLGKFLGVFLMNAVLLLVGAGVVLALVLWRVETGRFPEDQLAKLKSEALVGRRSFYPDRPNFKKLTNDEYDKRLKKGTLEKAHDKTMVLAEILRQVKANSTEVGAGTAPREFVFKNVRISGPEESMNLRYRFYAGSTSNSAQRMMEGLWGVQDPTDETGERVAVLPQRVISGIFHEITVPGTFVDAEGTVRVSYYNDDPKKESAIFQIADGPTLLVRVTGFVANYCRSMVLAVFQIAFLAALGCTVGAAFSTPVAAFVGVMYLAIGLIVQSAIDAPLRDDFGDFEYKGKTDRVLHYIAMTVGQVVVSVDDFDATSDLARGRLIETGRIAVALFGLLLFRSGLLLACGMLILTRRELGTVIRR